MGKPTSALNAGMGCEKQRHVSSFTTRVIPFISQFMSVSDRFSFLREWQKEAVRSKGLNSKAREFCKKRGLFRNGRR